MSNLTRQLKRSNLIEELNTIVKYLGTNATMPSYSTPLIVRASKERAERAEEIIAELRKELE